jgi:hypothetical protein
MRKAMDLRFRLKMTFVMGLALLLAPVAAMACPAITVYNPGNTAGTQGTYFSALFTQSGGAVPVIFSTTSLLPSGLNLLGDGTLYGTPTVTGTFPIIVTVTDTNSCPGTGGVYNLVINPACCDQDVNCDGLVNVIDVIKVQRVVLWLDTGASCPRCDVNHDSAINIGDMIKVQRVIYGYDLCM